MVLTNFLIISILLRFNNINSNSHPHFKPSVNVFKKYGKVLPSENTFATRHRIGIKFSECDFTVVNNNGESICVSEGDQQEVLINKSSMDFSIQNCTSFYQGIYGFYNLPLGQYVALITESYVAPVSKICGNLRVIRSLDFVKIPSVTGRIPESNDTMRRTQNELETLLHNTFARHSFYYSVDGAYDITRTYQCNVENGYSSESTGSTGSWLDCDDRFFWNLNNIAPLIEAGDYAAPFILPVANAWISSRDFGINGDQFSLSLISRRSRVRQGPRHVLYHHIDVLW